MHIYVAYQYSNYVFVCAYVCVCEYIYFYLVSLPKGLSRLCLFR